MVRYYKKKNCKGLIFNIYEAQEISIQLSHTISSLHNIRI